MRLLLAGLSRRGAGAPRSILQTLSGDVSKTSAAPSSDKSKILTINFPPRLPLQPMALRVITRSFHSAVSQVRHAPASRDAA